MLSLQKFTDIGRTPHFEPRDPVPSVAGDGAESVAYLRIGILLPSPFNLSLGSLPSPIQDPSETHKAPLLALLRSLLCCGWKGSGITPPPPTPHSPQAPLGSWYLRDGGTVGRRADPQISTATEAEGRVVQSVQAVGELGALQPAPASAAVAPALWWLTALFRAATRIQGQMLKAPGPEKTGAPAASPRTQKALRAMLTHIHAHQVT